MLAMDISRGMLESAAEKLSEHRDQVTLLHYQDFPLPYPDDTFDAVSCLEALEVMVEMEMPLRELHRVLKPGGAFLTSRGTEASGRKAKVRSVLAFTQLLEQNGFEQVEIIPWWKLFDRVRAVKPGILELAGNKFPVDVLVCSECDQPGFEKTEGKLMCKRCGKVLKFGREDIILYT